MAHHSKGNRLGNISGGLTAKVKRLTPWGSGFWAPHEGSILFAILSCGENAGGLVEIQVRQRVCGVHNLFELE